VQLVDVDANMVHGWPLHSCGVDRVSLWGDSTPPRSVKGSAASSHLCSRYRRPTRGDSPGDTCVSLPDQMEFISLVERSPLCLGEGGAAARGASYEGIWNGSIRQRADYALISDALGAPSTG